MKIAIVNDMVMAVECLRRALLSRPGYEVIWTAANGAEAVERCRQQRPDLVLMDMVMPVMGGAEATRRIMQSSPCPILVVTSSIDNNAAQVFETLGAGALDAVKTPILTSTLGDSDVAEFLRKVDMLGRFVATADRAPVSPASRSSAVAYSRGMPLVVIGASSGGPSAVEKVLGDLTADFPAPVIIVQHIFADFSREFAAWLDRSIKLDVRLAEVGSVPSPGEVLIARGGSHLVLEESGRLNYIDHIEGHRYQPSVDVFFHSVARHWRGAVVAVLLTGMGRDGADGMRALHRGGHYTIAQSEASCAVYGMPKAAVELGAVSQVLAPDDIAEALKANIGRAIVGKVAG